MLARYRNDILAALLLLALSIAFFWPVVAGGRTLLPADNLYQYLPWKAQADAAGVSTPHNALLSDLILENYPWKQFIVDSLQSRQLPQWNPYLFAGVPFLAAGQHSALYPLSILFYVLPLANAFGLFAALTLFLAALNMYIFVRVLGAGPVGGLIAGITYAFSSFFVVSVVFPMIISAAAWLPLLLAVIELLSRRNGKRTALLLGLGAIITGTQFLAGHVEIAYYNMMVLGFYVLARAVSLWREENSLRPALLLIGQAAVIVLLGLGLGAVQIVPLFELVRTSFRQGSASYSDVVGWAYPLRQIVTFFIPDFYGNPSQHSYFDVIDRTVKAAPTIFWGIKNYVEAGSYVGILPLLLAAVAVLRRARRSATFGVLVVLSLLFAFGTPLYAALFYGLPGYNQLHSAFRWVYPYTLSIAVLAGIAVPRSGSADGRARDQRREAGAVDCHCCSDHRNCRCLCAGRGGAVPEPLRQPGGEGAATFRSGARGVCRRADVLLLRGAQPAAVLPLPGRRGCRHAAHLAQLALVAGGCRRRARSRPVHHRHRLQPAERSQLLAATPPAIAFLQQDKDIFRVATLDQPDQKLLNQNTP